VTSTREPGARRRFGGRLVIGLVVAWTAIALLMSSVIGAYYETLAALVLLPPLALILAYCVTHRGRRAAWIAFLATLTVGLAMALAAAIPKGSSAFTGG